MLELSFFFIVFSALLSFSAFMVAITKNPINSLLFLIFCFCNSSLILFALELEYFPLIFLVIYVGAIAVLFLFVFMMINLRFSILREPNSQFFLLFFLFFLSFLAQVFIVFQADFVFDFTNPAFFEFTASLRETHYPDFGVQLERSLKTLGYLLFFRYNLLFLISGLILLVAMLGTIFLTLQKQFKGKKQSIPHQVLTCLKLESFEKRF